MKKKKKKKQRLTECDAPFLPQEIITNILKRLPVKSLLRFRLVCKQWKDLIKTPSFIADHLQHSRAQNPLLLWHRNDVHRCRRLQTVDYHSRVPQVLHSPSISSKARIVGATNGLLCLKFYRKFPSLPFLILWNPATREAWEVPESSHKINDEFEVAFGFSPSLNDYKIVISCGTQFFDDDDIRVEVYSLSTESWKEVKAGKSGGVEFLNYPPVTVNGTIFWLGCKKKEDDDDDEGMIISFDTVREVFSLISLPASLDFDSLDWLTEYEKKLAILSHEHCVIDLWVMEEEEEGTGPYEERWVWSKIYSISTFKDMVPRCIWADEIVCFLPYTRHKTGLYLFNLNTHRFKSLATCRRGSTLLMTSNHVESLVPIANIRIQEP